MRVESSGCFTLDEGEAVRRLAESGLAPEFAVLKLVQAGVASGAPRVDVQVGWWETSVSFEPERPLALDGLLQQALRRGRPEHHLAVACALGQRQGRFTLESAGRRTHFTARGSWVESCGMEPHGRGSPALRVRYRRGWGQGNREKGLLRDRCAWSPAPVFLQGSSLRLPYWTGGQAEELYFDERAGLAFPPYSRAAVPPRIPRERAGGAVVRCSAAVALGAGELVELVQDGVVLERRRADCRAVLDVTGLPTDLSEFRLRDTPELQRALIQMHERAHALRGRLLDV